MSITVLGEGKHESKMWFIGEAPGEQEEKHGRPFIGGAGGVLEGVFHQTGIKRSEVFIDNVIQRRPTKNDFSIFYTDKGRNHPTQELLEASQRIRDDINKWKPNIVVALGNEALRAITGKNQITHWRGSLLSFNGIKVMPALHPAMVMRQYEYRPMLVMDITKAKQESISPLFPKPYQDNFKINPSYKEVIDTLEFLETQEYVAFDIETGGEQIICLGFGWSIQDSICIPFFYGNNSWWNSEEELVIVKAIRKLFHSKKVKFIAQNAQFDMIYLGDKLGVEVDNLWMDTMVAFHCQPGYSLVNTLQGTIPIKDLVGRNDVWVWSYDNLGQPAPAKASDIRLTRSNTQIIRVHYWYKGAPGEGLITDYIDTTPDHLFKLEGGDWIEAQKLFIGASLTRLKLTRDDRGSECITIRKTQLRTSQYVANYLGIKGDIIHHKDSNILNNNPENLEGHTRATHNVVTHLGKKHKTRGLPAWNSGRLISANLSISEVKALYDSGMSTLEIAKVCNTDAGSIVHFMQNHGIKARTLSEAQKLRRQKEKNAKVLKIEWLQEKADVYNMEVDTLHCYASNKIIVHNCVYPELKKGLAFLCSIYTNRPYYKDMPGSIGNTPDILWTYNCLDTVVTWECAMKIRKEAEEFGTLKFYQENSHKLIKPLIQMQRRGVLIDIEKRKRIDENLELDISNMCSRLHKAVGHELNPLSPKQMKEFLYDELKLPQQIDDKTGNPTVDGEALDVLFKKYNNPVFKLIQDIRKVRKLLSTYIRADIDPDERMRCSYVITGTETGRLSSRSSVYGRGTNLQNIPRGDIVRSIFIPDVGRIFINADLSQAEARVVAYLSGEERLQNLFSDPTQDIHKKNAAMVFSKGIKEVTQDERQLAKTLVHAANYGIGPRTFAKHIGKDEGTARELLNQYYSLYPAIKRWHLEVQDKLGKTRIMRTPLGRARMFFGRWGQDLVREAIAYVPQSLVSDIINLGIINSFYNLPPEWELILQVHDAILMQVPEKTPHEQIVRFIKHYFEFPVEINGKQMIIPVDIKWGKTWAKMEKMEA